MGAWKMDDAMVFLHIRTLSIPIPLYVLFWQGGFYVMILGPVRGSDFPIVVIVIGWYIERILRA